MYDLGTLGGNNSQGNAINAAADVAGWSQLPADALGNAATHAFLSMGGSGLFDLGTLLRPDGNSVAYGINGNDDVVGVSDTVNGDQHGFAFGFAGGYGVMLDLNAFLPPNTGVVTSALGINDSGAIVGTMKVPSGTGTATVGYLTSPYKLTKVTLKRGVIPGGCLNDWLTTVIDSPAPAGGILLALNCTIDAAIPPPSVFIPPGASTATVAIKTIAVAQKVTGAVTATLGDIALSASLTVRPISIKSVSLSPNPVTGGSSVIGTVTLECPAAPGDITVNVCSSNPAVAGFVSPTFTIPAGSLTGSFAINTVAVPTTTYVKIEAMANGITKYKTLTVNP